MGNLDLGGGIITAGGAVIPGLSPTSDEVAVAYYPGSWSFPAFATLATLSAPQLNVEYAVPLDVSKPMTYDRIGSYTVTGATGALARYGIRADSGDKSFPGSLILDTGTVDASAGSTQVLATISQAIATVARYWLTVVWQSVAPGSVEGFSSGCAPLPSQQTNPFTAKVNGFSQSGVTGALPASWTGSRVGVTTVPLIGVRVASIP